MRKGLSGKRRGWITILKGKEVCEEVLMVELNIECVLANECYVVLAGVKLKEMVPSLESGYDMGVKNEGRRRKCDGLETYSESLGVKELGQKQL